METFSRLFIQARTRLAALRRRLPRLVRTFGLPLGLLLAGIWLGNVLFSENHEAPSDAEIMAPDGAVVEFWTCSMHPHVRKDGPGACPICGMDLIPVAGGHDHADMQQVSISEHAAALLQVQVWPAERRAVAGEVRLNGRIDFDERALSDVIVRTEGQVERLLVNYAQAPVRRGQPLAEIFSPAILTASLELLQAYRAAERGGMPELVAAAQSQLALLGVSEAQIERILASGEPLRTFTLYAPAGGVVTQLSARQGDWLGSGARLMQVGGLGQVWAQFEAYESDLARLRTGQTVRFTVDAAPGRAFEGPIAFIDPVVDGNRRTARVRVPVPNAGGVLRPGMLARGRVTAGLPAGREAPLVIPASAPLLTGTRAIVYVQIPEADRPTFEAREVALGSRAGDFFEVLEGLQEGELVVVHGAFRLDSELQIRGGRSMMSPAGGRAAVAHDHGLRAEAAPAEPLGTEIDLAPAVAAYIALIEALAGDDAAAARRAAERMERALRAIGVDDRGWQRLRGPMTAALSEMQRDGADLDRLRHYLQPLTTALAAAAEATGYAGPLYRAFCPMAFDFQGAYWLQRGREIANPYFGARMLACGTIDPA